MHELHELFILVVNVNGDPHNDVQRILYGRYHIDLFEIVAEFDAHFARFFSNGKNLLLGILNENAHKIKPFKGYAEIISHLQAVHEKSQN
jgi:hypothetical protein